MTMSLCCAVWKCRPEAGFGNTYPWTRASPGFADVWLQGHSESPGVHFLRPAGNCKWDFTSLFFILLSFVLLLNKTLFDTEAFVTIFFFNFFTSERHCPWAGWPCVEVCQGPEWQPCGAEVYWVCPAPGPTVHYWCLPGTGGFINIGYGSAASLSHF